MLQRVTPGEDRRHRVRHRVQGDVGHEPEASLVDADQRYARRGEGARGREHAAVAAEDDGEAGPRADPGVVRDHASPDAGLRGSLLLDEDVASAIDQEARKRSERRGDIAALVAADQRDGLERGCHGPHYNTPELPPAATPQRFARTD